MATITARKRQDGTTAYTAQIRIKRKGKIIYQETKTFDRKRLAETWANRRELELQSPGGLDHALRPSITIRALIERYTAEVSDLSSWGSSKAFDLKRLASSGLGELDATTLTVSQIIDFVRTRRLEGAGPATAGNDLVWLRTVLKAARALWDIPAALQEVNDAAEHCRIMGLIAKSRQRDRRPTAEELDQLRDYFARRDNRAEIPMLDIMEFALLSARRQDEITRLKWTGLRESDHTVLVEDLKHPRYKTGNTRRAKLLLEAWEVIQRQPKTSEFIFPYKGKSIGAAFTRACHVLGIKDLRFHDLRHEATCRLFERGYAIQEVMMFTLHESWTTLKRYTHLNPGDVPQR